MRINLRLENGIQMKLKNEHIAAVCKSASPIAKSISGLHSLPNNHSNIIILNTQIIIMYFTIKVLHGKVKEIKESHIDIYDI